MTQLELVHTNEFFVGYVVGKTIPQSTGLLGLKLNPAIFFTWIGKSIKMDS